MPFATWAEVASGGDPELARLLMGCAARFLLRHGCATFEGGGFGWGACVRLFRAVAAIREDGTVRSVELFRTRDPEAFLLDPAERSASLNEASWDDRAALFSPLQPPRRTREVPTALDFDGSALRSAVPDMVRQFEFLLNSDLRLRPDAADIVLTPGPRGAHRPMRTEFRAAFAATLTSVTGHEAPRALAAFRKLLDAGRLGAIQRAGINGVRAHNWLCGFERASCQPAVARRRLQAVTAYPITWSLIAAPTGHAAEAVSAERPLAPALGKELGIPESAVRRLASLDVESAGLAASPDADGLSRLAARVARMPPGASPRTPAGWRAFLAALSLADRLDGLRDGLPPAGPTLLASAAGKWDALDAEALGQAAQGIGDMARDFHANAMAPAALHHGVDDWTVARSLDAVVGARSLAQLAEASAWWHREQAAIRQSLGDRFPFPGRGRTGASSWPSLHKGGDTWKAANGLVVQPLLDEAALVGEHERLGHCVNQYAPNCLLSGSHILSIRSADGLTSLGTVEFSQEAILVLAGKLAEPPDAPIMSLPPGVVQFKAAHNALPRLEAWVALWDYTSAVLTGALEVDAKGLRLALETRLASAGTGRSVACYDASRGEAAMEAWADYLPLLPKSVARRGPAALLGAGPVLWSRSRPAEAVGPAPSAA